MVKKNFKEIDKIVESRILWEAQNKVGWFIVFYYNNLDYMISDIFDSQKNALAVLDKLRGMPSDEFKKIVMRAIDDGRIYERVK